MTSSSLIVLRCQGHAENAIHQIERFAGYRKSTRMRCGKNVRVLRSPRTVPLQIVHEQAETITIGNINHCVGACGRRAGRWIADIDDRRDELR